MKQQPGAPGCPVYNWPMADAVANAVARISQGGTVVGRCLEVQDTGWITGYM